MARWRLRNAHYLNVPGTEWEYKETDQQTGRQGRKVFEVPLHLDPNNPADCNYPGEIVVSDGKGAQQRDIIFVGEPTPDMEPLDDAATAISKECEPKWQHPIESLGGESYSQSLLQKFEREIDKLASGKLGQTPNVGQVSAAEFKALQAQVESLMAMNAELQAKVEPKAQSVRRA